MQNSLRHSEKKRCWNAVLPAMLVWFGLASMGVAQDTDPLTNLAVPQGVLDFVQTYQVLFGGVLGTALGVLGKWVFDQISAERAARRQFAQEITKQITDLATNHYWSLANYAGVLAGQLESYLDNRDHYLMLNFRDHSDLETSLETLADETALASFHQFCRLIELFDAFQFRKSNTYLLTSHAAGEMSKKLYNTFVSSLPTGAKNNARDAENIDTLKIVKHLRVEAKEGSPYKGTLMAEVPTAYFMEELANDAGALKDELAAYRHWIWRRIPEVEQAVDALRAYNALLSHELALIYRDFYKDDPVGTKLYLSEVAFKDWPHLMTEQTFLAMERATVQSALLRPLGAPTMSEEGKSVQTSKPREGISEDKVKPSDTPGSTSQKNKTVEDPKESVEKSDETKTLLEARLKAAQMQGKDGPNA